MSPFVRKWMFWSGAGLIVAAGVLLFGFDRPQGVPMLAAFGLFLCVFGNPRG